MEGSCEVDSVYEGPKVKPDNDSAIAVTPVTTSNLPIKVKKEKPENEAIDPAVPEAEESADIFGDVDHNDVEIVDNNYEGIVDINGVNHFVCEGFKIPQIPTAVIITRPLYLLYDCMLNDHIVLNPAYQREVVWDEGRASLLIASILMGYFIPPIIFNVKSKIVDVGGKKEVIHNRICVDGKQRLTSVHKFMTGMIGFTDNSHPPKKWFYCHPSINGIETPGNHSILADSVKQFFRNKTFCCYEYDELSLDTEETMFQLVQRGVALTPAEKMRAMSTEWALFTKQYEEDYSMIVNLSKQSRASGFRLILTIFTMIQEVMSNRRKKSAIPTLQASPQALLKILEDRAPINPALKLKFKAIFDRYETLIKLSSAQITTTRFKVKKNSVFDPAPNFLRDDGVNHVRTFSPLELIATAILVSYHGDRRSDTELIEDVKEMRRHLRLNHKDLRVNGQCWVTVWDFISEEVVRLHSNIKEVNGKEVERDPAPVVPSKRPNDGGDRVLESPKKARKDGE